MNFESAFNFVVGVPKLSNMTCIVVGFESAFNFVVYVPKFAGKNSVVVKLKIYI